ncbi:uncharacterized protein N7459_004903 [Penicillium hispanicum]|uniref:uncharacterized protein n=1 Tax=Penicillium hispanicum TaxID=1080232 RepID=UPI00254056D2|nr:uncharacterized protein N7459_004903 [Penicillium hispanicum]KAJ5585103.1 hypothetical protein N7459_004903 [Penicillium hispanicum]
MAHDPAPDVAKSEQNEAADISPRPMAPERRGSSFMNFVASVLGSKNPLAHPADPQTNTVWLLDNTAYQPVSDDPNQDTSKPWQAEFVACIFETEGRKDIGKLVASILDHMGLDGEMGSGAEETRQRIEQRIQPFLDQVSPGRTVTLDVSVEGSTQSHLLGPSDRNGIISQTIDLGTSTVEDGTVVHPQLQNFGSSAATMATRFVAPEGWLVISDIDDTIKRTMTREITGILRTTFAEEPVPITGMPEFYRHIHNELNPAWFYLSASPYNLYSFLHAFLHEHYCPGTLVLRDYSWMDIGGLIKSFTEKTQEYKVDRLEKIRRWFPNRRVLCIGDSTQKDPEAYADMYRRYPGWVHGIIIRKVTDVAHMEENNKPERFEEAFKDLPANVWTVFEDTRDLYEFVDTLGMEDQAL